ncbi:DNA-binding protein YbiB [beta proteobacterium MWH-UniP1]
MGIGAYIRRVGRKRGDGHALTRPEAADLMAQVLDRTVTDLEVGAFCMAMRIKGESADELAGFMDALQARVQCISAANGNPVVVIPSYNGARKFPVLTPLLGLMLAQRGVPVLMHGMPTEDVRVSSGDVLRELGIGQSQSLAPMAAGEFRWVDTALLCPGLARLLEVRRALTLRNTGHSLAKMINPIAGKSLLLSSYTHGEYSEAMQEAMQMHHLSAMLFHGLEGEVIAEARRLRETVFILNGQHQSAAFWADQMASLSAETGRGLSLSPQEMQIDAAQTAAYTQKVLSGQGPVSEAVAAQVALITRAWQAVC